jgi:hypothetical protein
MAANIKATLMALMIGNAIVPNSYAAQPSPADLCLDIAKMPIKSVTDKLKLFAGDVLGKNAELWGEQDFQALLANIRNCDGKPEGLQPTVSYYSWSLALNAIYPVVRAVTDISIPITAKYEGIFPANKGRILCTDIFAFRKDPIWLMNNSDEIFGVAFENMTPHQLRSARSFLSECQPVLKEVLKLRGKNDGDVDRLIKSINTSIDRDQKIPQIQIENLDPDLVPLKDGKPVPLAYVSPNTVTIVRRVNTSLRRKIRLQMDDMVLISKWADNVFDLIPAGPDRAYAEKVKLSITRSMFPE